MLTIRYQNRFAKDFKLMLKRGYDENELWTVVDLLANQVPLPAKYCDHPLIGNYAGYRECHIRPDWLLIYEIKNDELLLVLTRTGSHSDLF
ncbi:MAG: type II toxin-antitoxin system YafQ family toxin [Ruminococcus sp.]|nr:type II toxin-antitoxin system YafQ family toxin [Ruminococcus sp.]